MKKVMLILVLLMAGSSQGWWGGDDDICNHKLIAGATWDECKEAEKSKEFSELIPPIWYYKCGLCKKAILSETELKVEGLIEVGQIWKRTLSGDSRRVLEVGQKYVVFGFVSGGDENYPSVETKTEFRKDYELVEPTESELLVFIDSKTVYSDFTITADTGTHIKIIVDSVDYVISQEPEKAYIHKNPNNDHWICSKHGDLESDDFLVSSYAAVICFEDISYCRKCLFEVSDGIISQYIIGIKQ
ncbi:hypothetical protein LCGC14_0538690 [marine sediment metagenome]|uniref:Uncharacterized protein n=1 Tax=marine sediment metagenome TaxID=412755 RepID=A0A0F9RY79_9ZZZZ